jgi:hypothetical protein
MITIKDVLSVCSKMNCTLPDEQIKWIVDNFHHFEMDDPTSHWVDIVEDIILRNFHELINNKSNDNTQKMW